MFSDLLKYYFHLKFLARIENIYSNVKEYELRMITVVYTLYLGVSESEL